MRSEPRPWPEGFARGRSGRDSVLVLASLAGLLPRKVAETARREGTASACLRAVRAGELGSDMDRVMADRERAGNAVSRGVDLDDGVVQAVCDPDAALADGDVRRE